MNAFDKVRGIAEKTAPGRPPAYSEAHALKALELIGSQRGIGRQQLSRKLELGEGTIRTLIRRMKKADLIEVSRGGMMLTSRGRETLSDLARHISTCELPETRITVGPINCAVLVKGAIGNVGSGVEQRDAALIAGAEGATTLVYEGGKLLMPGTEVEIDPLTENYVLEKLNPIDGDVVIIGTASSQLDAEIGAKSAALKLLEKTIQR